MRAVRCHAYGDLANLAVEDLPNPLPGPGEVLVEVHAVGINFADGLMVLGQYQEKPPLPFVPGLEAAGVVAACGEGVTRVRPGDRVTCLVDTGAYADAAPGDRLFPIPMRWTWRRRHPSRSSTAPPMSGSIGGPAAAGRDAAGPQGGVGLTRSRSARQGATVIASASSRKAGGGRPCTGPKI
jgi:NADPH2:quinone reductase